jgi:hypothetical protein
VTSSALRWQGLVPERAQRRRRSTVAAATQVTEAQDISTTVAAEAEVVAVAAAVLT